MSAMRNRDCAIQQLLLFSGHADSSHFGVEFLVHGAKAGKVVQIPGVIERVACFVIRLQKKETLYLVHAYSAASAYDDEAADIFYEDIEVTMNRGKTSYTRNFVVMPPVCCILCII